VKFARIAENYMRNPGRPSAPVSEERNAWRLPELENYDVPDVTMWGLCESNFPTNSLSVFRVMKSRSTRSTRSHLIDQPRRFGGDQRGILSTSAPSSTHGVGDALGSMVRLRAGGRATVRGYLKGKTRVAGRRRYRVLCISRLGGPHET